MSRRLWIVVGALIALIATAGSPSGAAADGLPLPIDGATDGAGITSLDGSARYATVTTVNRGTARTVLMRIDPDSGAIKDVRHRSGTWSIPLVAYDGTTSGLSADGARLALIEPRMAFPRRTTRFAIVDTERLSVQETVTLDGDFSFDALSPNGRLMYLIHYLDPRDPSAYEVRAFNLERGELLADPIVDEDAAPVTMGGYPQTRAVSPDGRWSYTLYAANAGHRAPFIHALDTKTGDAACIDLDPGVVDPRKLWRMELVPSADGATLEVVDRAAPVAHVDLGTYEVSEPAPAAEPERGGSGLLPWLAIGAGIGLLAIVAIMLRRRLVGVTEPLSGAELERMVAGLEPAEERREREPVP